MEPEWQGLTDTQWDAIKGLFPKPPKRPFRKAKRRGGRPRASDRKAFEALLWQLRGGTLERLPTRFGARRTACRRLATWSRAGLLERAWGWHIRGLGEEDLQAWGAALARSRRRIFWMRMLTTIFWLEQPRFLKASDAAAFRAS